MSYYKRCDWNAICDVCGFRYKASEMRKNWKGLYVCEADFEPRQPLDFIRGRTENQSTPWARPEPDDVFVAVCYLYDRSAYADLGSADCMLADNISFEYSFLYNLKHGI